MLNRCHRRLGLLSPPPAAGRSPTASVGAWGQRPSPRAAGRSPTVLLGVWGRSPSPLESGRSPLAISKRPGPESRVAAAGRRPPAPHATRPQPRHSTRARARQLTMASGDQATPRPSRADVPATEPQHAGRRPAADAGTRAGPSTIRVSSCHHPGTTRHSLSGTTRSDPEPLAPATTRGGPHDPAGGGRWQLRLGPRARAGAGSCPRNRTRLGRKEIVATSRPCLTAHPGGRLGQGPRKRSRCPLLAVHGARFSA